MGKRILVVIAVLLCAGCGADNSGGGEEDKPKVAMRDADGRLKLGYVTVGTNGVTAYSLNEIVPGDEAQWELVLLGMLPHSLKIWVGAEDADEATHTELEVKGSSTFRGAVSVPQPLPAGSALWIEIVDVHKKRSLKSLPLP